MTRPEVVAVACALGELFPEDIAEERARNLCTVLDSPPDDLGTVWDEACDTVWLRHEHIPADRRWRSVTDATASALAAYAVAVTPSHLAAFAMLIQWGTPREALRRLWARGWSKAC